MNSSPSRRRRLPIILAPALGLALAGASYSSVPAAGAKGRKRTVFFVDEAAASEVSVDLIDQAY